MQKNILTITLALLFIITGCAIKKENSYRAVRLKAINNSNFQQIDNIKKFGNYYAVLIYVDEYSNLTKLDTPKLDVEALSKILTQRYGFKESRIVRNPKNSDELIEVLDSFTKKLKEDDNLLIYYAGHGSYSKETDIGFWQLKDAKISSRVGWISLNQAINYTLSLIPAKHVLVLADSCYSGALVRGGEVKMGRQLNPDDKKYYSKLYSIKSRNALTSGTLQPVMDNDPKNPNHSVFANGVLFMLERNKKPIFSLEEKYPEIKRYVQLQSLEQIPLYKDIKQTGHEMGGDFIFIDRKVIKEHEKRGNIVTKKKIATEPNPLEPPIISEIKKSQNLKIVEDFSNGDSLKEIERANGIRASSKSLPIILKKKPFEISKISKEEPFKDDFSPITKVKDIF